LWQTVFKDDVELDVEFLSFVLKSEVYRNMYGIIATGTSPSMKNISQNSFLDLPIPFPEIETQKKIKTNLREFDTKASNAINAVEDSIGKLKEYRQSIISEAVTGKIDVRDWQPNKRQVA
jgi:type I restriction enzyme S subunit